MDEVKKDTFNESPLLAVGSTGQRNTLIFWQDGVWTMKQRRRIYYSSAQRSEIWDRWQAGDSMSSIGRRFDRESSRYFGDFANRWHSSTGSAAPQTGAQPL